MANGGRYLGFCLGGYLAGHDPGYSLLAPNDNAVQEIEEPGSQVQDEDDTIIQVDWEFSTGTNKGEKARGRWMYFQDGVALALGKESPAVVLGRYSSTGDVAALLSPFGRGWVGCVGPHPEADQSWCMFVVSRLLESVSFADDLADDDEEIENPDGIHFDIGHDFVRAVIDAPLGSVADEGESSTVVPSTSGPI